MPRVHHVKKARRAVPHAGIEVGDSYYWWAFRSPGARSGRKVFSKTYPKKSQLTQSDYWQAVYSLQETVEFDVSSMDHEELESYRDQLASEARQIADDQREKFDNMPEGLQQGDTGQLLESRIDACEEWADAIEAVEVPEREEGQTDDEYQTVLSDVVAEICGLGPDGD